MTHLVWSASHCWSLWNSKSLSLGDLTMVQASPHKSWSSIQELYQWKVTNQNCRRDSLGCRRYLFSALAGWLGRGQLAASCHVVVLRLNTIITAHLFDISPSNSEELQHAGRILTAQPELALHRRRRQPDAYAKEVKATAALIASLWSFKPIKFYSWVLNKWSLFSTTPRTKPSVLFSVGPALSPQSMRPDSRETTRGFRYDARVVVVAGWRWRQRSIGLCLETIIREADVRDTVDLPLRNWSLWAAGHWYSCADGQWQAEQGTLSLRVSHR